MSRVLLKNNRLLLKNNKLGLNADSGTPIGGGGTDPDAIAFTTAAGITDLTQISAVDALVISLKSYGIWTKMIAIYPFIGGTAITHKYNLVNPANTNAAYRLFFNGTFTHSSTGCLPNGSSSAITYINPSVVYGSKVHGHLSFYSRSNVAANTAYAMGGGVISNGNFSIYLNQSGNAIFVADHPGATYRYALGANANTTGFYVGTQQTTNIQLYKNGALLASNTGDDVGQPIPNVNYIELFNLGVFEYYDNKECAFASIGESLTNTETVNFYTAVQAYNTTLGRQV